MRSRRALVFAGMTTLTSCSVFVSTSDLGGGARSGPDEVPSPDGGGDAQVVTDGTVTAESGPKPLVGDSGVFDAGFDAAALDWATWPGNGHKYRVLLFSQTITWTNARQQATSAGGYLATVTSEAEGDFLDGMLANVKQATNTEGYGPWIGAYQPDRDTSDGGDEPAGGWVWVTGEPWSYTQWTDGEPNNAGNEEHFGHFFPGSRAWNDIPDHGSDSIRAALIEQD